MDLLKKLFFYFLLFSGLILSTSHLGDNYMGISDEEGYLLAIGISLETFEQEFLEFLELPIEEQLEIIPDI